MDESLRLGAAGLYLVTSAVVATDDLGNARDNVRSVLRPRQHRFHWRAEGEAARAAMLAQLAANSTKLVLGCVCHPMPARQERARALCLERVAWDLKSHGIDQLVIESREHRNDTKDAATIERARKAGRASPTLTYTFARPVSEPLLWLADAACGALGADLAEGNSAYVDQLPVGLLSIVDIAP